MHAEQFKGNLTFPAGDEINDEEFVANMSAIKTLTPSAHRLAKKMELNADKPGVLASVGEFILESLYVHNRLSKYNRYGKTFFRK